MELLKPPLKPHNSHEGHVKNNEAPSKSTYQGHQNMLRVFLCGSSFFMTILSHFCLIIFDITHNIHTILWQSVVK